MKPFGYVLSRFEGAFPTPTYQRRRGRSRLVLRQIISSLKLVIHAIKRRCSRLSTHKTSRVEGRVLVIDTRFNRQLDNSVLCRYLPYAPR